MKLVWRHSAELQLRSQLAFIRKVSPLAAKRMRNRIKLRLARLQHSPKAGHLTEIPGVRELIIAHTPYVAVYELSADTITILQFFHTSQDR
jgi:toxin ParE1/3/4